MEKDYTQYNFTPDYQEDLLACVVRYPEKFFGVGQLIKPSFFTGPLAIEVVQRLIEYNKHYGVYPSFTVLGNYAKAKASSAGEEHGKNIVLYVAKVAARDVTHWEGIRDLAVDFARERAVMEACRIIGLHQTKGTIHKINPVKLVEEALNTGKLMDDLGVALNYDSAKVIDLALKKDYGVSTGYSHLDAIWKFGWGPGWLVVPLAPPKRLKTTFCVNLAVKMATVGNADVLYYACEISQELAMMRAIYNISGCTEDEIWNDPEKYKIKIQQTIEEKLWGHLVFKSFAAKTATIEDIEAHAQQVIKVRGIKPRAIFLDYAETIRPSATDSKTTPDWRQQADIYVRARAMGQKLGCAVIMPDRCNKDAVDKKVPSMKSFQGSFEKAGAVDVAIGLCATDQEFMQRRMRYFIFLNRHGEQYQHFSGKYDPERMQMTIDQQIAYDPDEEEDSGKNYKRGHSVGGPRSKSAAEVTLDQVSQS